MPNMENWVQFSLFLSSVSSIDPFIAKSVSIIITEIINAFSSLLLADTKSILNLSESALSVAFENGLFVRARSCCLLSFARFLWSLHKEAHGSSIGKLNSKQLWHRILGWTEVLYRPAMRFHTWYRSLSASLVVVYGMLCRRTGLPSFISRVPKCCSSCPSRCLTCVFASGDFRDRPKFIFPV